MNERNLMDMNTEEANKRMIRLRERRIKIGFEMLEKAT